MPTHLSTWLLAAAVSLIAAPEAAQPLQTGTISGRIVDATGGALPGVTVTITSEDRGFARTTVTDDSGRYHFPSVPIGPYTVEATLPGFQTATATGNFVESERNTAVPLVMRLGGLTDTVTVTGTIPIVDVTNVTQTTRLRRDEFEHLPVGRSYQSLVGVAAGVVGTGNVNAMGALSSNNLFVIDAVDTTDPATGTFGTSLNFEAIQEISVLTSAAGAEYGRAQGAIVNVVTRSGTNRFEGAFKYIFANDNWNAQNETRSEVTGASLARDKFDQINPVYSLMGGGPIWRDRAWFFGTHERQENTTPERQTVGPNPENYQQVTESNFVNVRGTVQLRDGHTAWLKFYRSPTDGFVIDYWNAAAGERAALTGQSQTADNWAAQWSGVLRDTWSMEAAFADYSSRIDVTTFEPSGRLGNAPVRSLADGRFYNGATFNGFVHRPRRQFNVASNWFLTPGGRSHDVKVGVDLQQMKSGSLFQYPNAQYYVVESYDQATGSFVPFERYDYETGDSTSRGTIVAVYARDKLQLADRLFVEAGLRVERQTGESDIGATTVDTGVFAPRFSGSYDLSGNGRTLVTGSYGRYHASILQGFSDAFASVPQQQNYDLYTWNGAEYVFTRSVRVGGSGFTPPDGLKPSHMDEVTVGLQRQFGRNMGAGVRFIAREWGNLIDDIYTFRPDGSLNREVVNYEAAERSYRGVQLTFERRFSGGWSAGGSYTWSRTEGNHFDDHFSPLGDYLDAMCTTTLDPTIGTIPCAEVNNGANKYGRPTYDRPHNLKLTGTYVRPVGPLSLTVGAFGEFISKRRYERQRSMTVLRPGTNLSAGRTAVYFYEPRGTYQLAGLQNVIDVSTELGWRLAGRSQAAFKAEIFNLTNNQEKIINNNVAWCGSTENASCAAAVANFGKASARGSFLEPRRYRFSLIFRF